MEEEKDKLLQWHAAFFAGIQIELAEEAEKLTFESEHNLSTKPMQIDVLIIKKNREEQIQKNIGRIFRKYNIMEYKSPDAYLSIDDFYKVYGYTCFYKSDTGTVNEIKISELTITYVCRHYPRELIRHLKEERHISVEKQEAGIYYIRDCLFQIQLLVTSELSETTNLWMKHLTNDLKDNETAEKLIRDYSIHEKDKLYQSVMNIIVRANKERFKEVSDMCEALMELMKDKLDEREQQGERQGERQKLTEQIQKKIRKGKSMEQIAEELEETTESIRPIYNSLLQAMQ
ncbi:MAG: 3-isopropylmalate dehydrogenase [Lachnospiraceae bacterium]